MIPKSGYRFSDKIMLKYEKKTPGTCRRRAQVAAGHAGRRRRNPGAVSPPRR